MYRKPNQYINLRTYCKTRWSLPAQQANLLVDVELGLTLIKELHLQDEPLSILWVVLSGLPIPDPRLQNLNDDQRRAVANTRVILADYASRFAWIRDLRDYMGIPDQIREYQFDANTIESQTVDTAWRGGRDPDREESLRRCLYEPLQFSERGTRFPNVPGRYSFFIKSSSHRFTANLADTDIATGSQVLPWFSLQIKDRGPIRIPWADLFDTAQFLDSREQKANWVSRLDAVHLRPIFPDGTLGPENNDFILDGTTNWAGIVGSGKSTLTTLIAVLGIRNAIEGGQDAGWRTLLTQLETQSALDLTHRFNRWFGRDANTDPAVATALLGYSSRARHAAALFASKGYKLAVEEGISHWGERILDPTCPLQATILPGDWESAKLQAIPVGEEPCSSLTELAPPADLKYPRQFLCPLFAVCPSQQRYRDMADALVWITTPGALGQGSIPAQLDNRPVKISEVVYEQCDLVVLDEVDTVQEWFDRLYARETILVREELGGLLQRLDSRVTEYLNETPSLRDPDTLRWMEAVRHARIVAQKILMLLDREEGYSELPDWIERGHFTAMNLFSMLAHRMCGLRDQEDPISDQSHDQLQTLIDLFSSFQAQDPLDIPEPVSADASTWFENAIYRLGQIAKDIMDLGTSRQDANRESQCIQWLLTVSPNIEELLAATSIRLSVSPKTFERDFQVDTLQTLARRLEFTICATLLDRQTHIVFYQRHRIAAELANDESLFYRGIPKNLVDLLPVPPTGRSFGIYYSHPPQERSGQSASLLSTYGYTNIGRSFVLGFNTLRLDIEARKGPHVLALSGTSYLPGSTLWHFDVPVSAVLEPTPDAINALKTSSFAFAPCEYQRDPIFVSGSNEKRQQLERMARVMIEGDKLSGGRLGRELAALDDLELHSAESWMDRSRLLLLTNSYDQSEWVSQELQRQWPTMSEYITHLVRQGDEETDDDWFKENVIARSDIERIRELDTRIVVAPLQAIGRAFNILNKYEKAAFGSIYFLTRPMPYPEGVQLIAQEVNSRAIEWANNPNDEVWASEGVYQKGVAIRQRAYQLWRSVESRTTYAKLTPIERHDLAMTTIGRLMQAVGRLVRGDVPFRAYFVDAAWAPKRARGEGPDSVESSLLAAMIESLSKCVHTSSIGIVLYAALLERLEETANFDWIVQ